MENKILIAALKYAARGWAVFPCIAGGKIPATPDGFYSATNDPKEVERLFKKYPNSNIGLATGDKSGLFVVDIDIKNNAQGDISWHELIKIYGEIPHTIEAITWSGGRHILFQFPENKAIGCKTGIRKGIDIKSQGGYIVIAPSKFNGKEYAWEVSCHPETTPLAPAPQWLLDLVKENRPRLDSLDNEVDIPEGRRNTTLMRIGVKLRNTGLSQQVITEVLQKTNMASCNPPLREEEVSRISQSIARYETEFIPVDNNIITLTHRDADVMIFSKNGYEFRFTNLNISGNGKLKSILTLSKDKKYLLKTEINLSIQAHREKFIQATKDKDIEQILVELENLIRKQLKREEEDAVLKAKQAYIMTDEEREQATKFMQETQDILYKVIMATNRIGVVGEETLRLMVYLCFSSRILKEPLSMTVKGESSSGKSFSCQSVQRLIPEEGYHFITKATQQAFFHMPEDGLQHRIVYINEMQGSEQADYSIRTAQSEGDLILMMPIKDERTGNMETITKKVKGPVGFLITTTKARMFDENETRNFSIFSDDSPELTQNIGDISIRKAQGEVFELDEKEINLWKNMQRLLKSDLKVIIPYAKEVLGSFPNKPVRIRRDRERFRVLINVITILHQAHRKIEDGKIYSTLADYHIAKVLAEETLIKTIFESSPAADTLFCVIQQMEEEFVPIDEKVEFNFTYQDIADKLEWTKDKTKKWMLSLIKNGVIEYTENGGGKFKQAIMRFNKHKKSDYKYFLPEVNELTELYPCPKELFYNPVNGNEK